MRIKIILVFCILSCFARGQNMARQDSIQLSDSLFVWGYDLYNENKFNEALPIFQELLNIDIGLYETEHYQRIVYDGMWLGSTLYKLGRENEAAQNEYTQLYYRADPVDPRLMDEADSLANLAYKLMDDNYTGFFTEDDPFDKLTYLLNNSEKQENGNPGDEELIHLFRKRGKILNSILPHNHIWAANNDYILAKLISSDISDFNFIMFPFSKDKRIPVWHRLKAERDSLYFNYVKSVKLLHGENSKFYINTLYSSFQDLCEGQEITTDIAVILLDEGYKLCKLNFPNDTLYLSSFASNLGEANRLIANYEFETLTTKVEGLEYISVLELAMDHYGAAISSYEDILSYTNIWQGIVWAQKRKAECFFKLADIASSLYSNRFSSKDYTYYYELDESNDKESHYKEIVNIQNFLGSIFQSTEELDSDRKLEFELRLLGSDCLKDAINHYPDKSDPTFSKDEYIDLWLRLAQQQSYSHLFESSIESYKIYGEYCKEFEDYDGYASSLNSILLEITSIVDYSKNQVVLERIIKEGESFLDSINEISMTINNESLGGGFFYSKLSIIGTLGDAYYKLGKLTSQTDYFVKAIPYLKEKMDSCLINRYRGDPNYFLSFISECEWQIGKYEESMKKAIQHQKTLFNNYLNLFLFSTHSLREQMMSFYASDLDLFTERSYLRKEYAGAGTLAYNKELFTKGLLASSETMLMDFIYENSSDDQLRNLYQQWNEAKYKLESIIFEKKRYEFVVDSLESQMLLRCRTIGKYNDAFVTEWQKVQRVLSENEIAIEFARFFDGADFQYLSIILKKGYNEPRIYRLFKESEIRLIPTKNYYNTTQLAELIFSPLFEELKDVTSVYFAPIGQLNNISMESLPIDTSVIMSDKWNMYRLSSTRELVNHNKDITFDRAVLYGGITYDTEVSLLVADAAQYGNRVRSLKYEDFCIADSLNMRSGVAYLPGTKTETEDIANALKLKNAIVSLETDTLATEGNFKSLSGKRISLLHIATHGFYWTKQESLYQGNLSFLSLNENKPRYIEDNALTRSGLLFAGANNALMGKPIPDGVDDGIVTAKEISTLDLRGLDLVVLSACQTGLGEIKGDGVYGLQRGFKKAGANSIMMSLWKVDDTATRMLMTQFYKNLTSGGMSKHESLKQAQKYLREYEVEVEVTQDSRHQISVHAKEQTQQEANKEKTTKKVKKYQDPYYWAGFILLDAIN